VGQTPAAFGGEVLRRCLLGIYDLVLYAKVNIRLHGKGDSKHPWRKAEQSRHPVDVVDSDQQVVNKELSRD